jgi:hypothetical protein
MTMVSITIMSANVNQGITKRIIKTLAGWGGIAHPHQTLHSSHRNYNNHNSSTSWKAGIIQTSSEGKSGKAYNNSILKVLG